MGKKYPIPEMILTIKNNNSKLIFTILNFIFLLIKIDIIKANKGVYYLKTNKGERCLKKINYGPQKLLFVYGAKEHLIKNGFESVDRYFLNNEGEPYALVNEDLNY